MIYQINGFADDYPHWSACYIEADTADDAMARLEEIVNSPACPETVWADDLQPRTNWKATPVLGNFEFVLGNGCR